jgi:alpha-ribazole phosphatase
MYNRDKTMKAVFLRHGQTAGNLEKRYVGSTDEPLLPEAVRKLQRQKEEGFFGDALNTDLLFASPMLRCRQTAAVLCPGRAPFLVEDLRECSFGKFEYRNYRELAKDPDYQKWIDSGGTLPFPGGEDRRAFSDRCRRAFCSTLEKAVKEEADRLLYVVHGGSIMSILEKWASPQRNYFFWQCQNGCGYETEIRPSRETEEGFVLVVPQTFSFSEET